MNTTAGVAFETFNYAILFLIGSQESRYFHILRAYGNCGQTDIFRITASSVIIDIDIYWRSKTFR